MKKIAIIPARGGSKRIPRKNIKNFLGKPIIAYSIQTALDSQLFDEVMVSTDDHAIAEVSKQYGAQVPFLRSPKNADDHATTADVIKEVLSEYQHQKTLFDAGCCLYPTAPFITAGKLREAYQRMVDQRWDAVFPVVRYPSPIQRAWQKNTDGHARMAFPQFAQTRSQDLEPAYYDAGQFYWFMTEGLSQRDNIVTERSGFVISSEWEVHDIDDEQDWIVAEYKYSYFRQTHANL